MSLLMSLIVTAYPHLVDYIFIYCPNSNELPDSDQPSAYISHSYMLSILKILFYADFFAGLI
jgi:hypothetical protein